MLPTKIMLVDQRSALVLAWEEAFDDFDAVEAIEGDFFEAPADAMVSPANSFGIMDGGLDLAIRETRGSRVQDAVQKVILEKHHGELPVGAAEVVETGHAQWRYLVSAPTMRVPENNSQTTNAYLAFRATLLAVRRLNEEAGDRVIDSVLYPGLGTGIGRLDPRRCAAQMRVAYKHVIDPPRIPSFQMIHTVHQALLRA